MNRPSLDLTQQQQVILGVVKEVHGALKTCHVRQGTEVRCCQGIVTENADACIELAAARGLRGARFALAGLRSVVYWPHVPEVPRVALAA